MSRIEAGVGINIGVNKQPYNPAVFGKPPERYLEPKVNKKDPTKAVYAEGLKMWLVINASPVQEVEPGEVAIHEAEHVVAARENGTKTVKASIIPQGDSLGHTIYENADIVGTMGPHSRRRRGSGYDKNLAEKLGNADAAEAVARSYLDNNPKKVKAVAVDVSDR